MSKSLIKDDLLLKISQLEGEVKNLSITADQLIIEKSRQYNFIVDLQNQLEIAKQKNLELTSYKELLVGNATVFEDTNRYCEEYKGSLCIGWYHPIVARFIRWYINRKSRTNCKVIFRGRRPKVGKYLWGGGTPLSNAKYYSLYLEPKRTSKNEESIQ